MVNKISEIIQQILHTIIHLMLENTPSSLYTAAIYPLLIPVIDLQLTIRIFNTI